MFPSEPPFNRVQFYLTAAYPCSYLPNREARSQVATPAHLITTDVYGKLIQAGFRRSGQFTYRPQCVGCQACVPVRVQVENYQPSRSQKRCRRRNQDLRDTTMPLNFVAEHYALYRKYQCMRHSGGGMDQDNADQYGQFLLASHVDSSLVEFREGDKLVMVSVVDRVKDGLSAVYTFFDPDYAKRSLGVYSVLWLIERARQMVLPYVYLGYWIAESRKMSYKQQYQPLEGLIEGHWQPLPE
ncbi:MAG: arginyltransferase [Thiobacillaceae bacterium]|jgi:arginyl-tRNA--protein-N-Asp/Glu arginylyltransferase